MTGFRIWLTLMMAALLVALPIDSVVASTPHLSADQVQLDGGHGPQDRGHGRADLEEERDSTEKEDASDDDDDAAHSHAPSRLADDPAKRAQDGRDAHAGLGLAWTSREHLPRGPPTAAA